MTVGELLLELKFQPQDLEVFVCLANGKQLSVDEVGFACPELADPYIFISTKSIKSEKNNKGKD